jgi:hypothetical protein
MEVLKVEISGIGFTVLIRGASIYPPPLEKVEGKTEQDIG